MHVLVKMTPPAHSRFPEQNKNCCRCQRSFMVELAAVQPQDVKLSGDQLNDIHDLHSIAVCMPVSGEAREAKGWGWLKELSK